jgi:malonate-semialdehyde dehydrogenase (acetylating)/methylmalonate-semialdehyde dehydrogenase
MAAYGSLLRTAHRDKVAGYIDIAQTDGVDVVVDGRGIEVNGPVLIIRTG